MSGPPSFQCPAAMILVTTSRTCPAVTAVASSAGPSRTASSGRIHDVRPGSSAATSEYGQPGIICALPFPARVAVAEQPLRAGDRVRPQPVAHVHRQPDPPVIPGRQRQRRQRPPQPGDADPARVERLIHRAVPAAALRLQRQLAPAMCTRSCLHSTASHTSNSASARAVKHRYSSPRNPASRPRARAPSSAPGSTSPPAPRHTERHGHRLCLQVLWQEPEDHHAVAVLCQRPGQHRLNGKLWGQVPIENVRFARRLTIEATMQL